ncbi:hypothetical protein ACHAXM_007886 [Skeletonema potamos]
MVLLMDTRLFAIREKKPWDTNFGELDFGKHISEGNPIISQRFMLLT